MLVTLITNATSVDVILSKLSHTTIKFKDSGNMSFYRALPKPSYCYYLAYDHDDKKFKGLECIPLDEIPVSTVCTNEDFVTEVLKLHKKVYLRIPIKGIFDIKSSLFEAGQCPGKFVSGEPNDPDCSIGCDNCNECREEFIKKYLEEVYE